jgi:hypothetical protein
MTHTPFSNRRFAKKAHMGQSKVNVPKAWPEKTVFFGPDMTCITESGRRAGMLTRINEDERLALAVSSESRPGLDPGWIPLRVKKTRQNKRMQPSVLIRSEPREP